MPSLRSTIGAAAAVALSLVSSAAAQGATFNTNHTCPDPNETCTSSGVDFQAGGVYFQDIDSSSPFTFSSKFDGCQQDFAYNILVTPTGDRYTCSNTSIATDNAVQISTCPVEESQLTTGEYKILLLSNNGECSGLAASRLFYISAGTQVTSTVTPVVSFTSTSTPIVTETVSSVTTSYFYLPTPTVTSAKSIKKPTVTVTPKKTVVTSTTILSTKTITSYNLLVAPSLVTKTAHCHQNSTAGAPDTSATSASIASIVSAASAPYQNGSAATPTTASYRRRSLLDISNDYLNAPVDAAHVIAKRAPESSVVYTVITQASLFSTVVKTVTAPAVTFESTVLSTASTTSTPQAVTLYINEQTTTTLPTSTSTHTRTIKHVLTTVYNTKYSTTKIQITTTPSAAASKCAANGGYMA